MDEHSIDSRFFSHLILSSKKTFGESIVMSVLDTTNQISEEARIPLEWVYHFLTELQIAVGRKLSGLDLAKSIFPSSFSLVGHLIMSCRTLGESLENVVSYHSHIMDCDLIEVSTEGDQACLIWVPISSDFSGRRIFIEFILSALWQFGKWATGKEQSFSEIHVSQLNPLDVRKYSDFFRCTVLSCTTENRVVFPKYWLDLPMLNHNAEVKALLVSKLNEKRRVHVENVGKLHQMRLLLKKKEYLQEGLINRIAKDLNTSERSLQRYLKNNHTNFSTELRMARLKRAEELLVTTNRNISDIALEVGYSEQSAFSHAYKVWKGFTPMKERINSERAIKRLPI